ncbi:acyl-CoA N-acyltransferase [Hesseltinella vesiculosa]|uniref:Acyl-CoA N-acyltransferase n=1 Tax=Hesseltinella vesiculosa TaxID=101127 RepID=A0A1X2GV24_9FUNG|nr:acyl-CoA N-acyltransferase [Hesseltinella vesiculosa]
MHIQSWKATYRGLVPDKFLDEDVYEDRRQQWLNKLPFQTDTQCVQLAYDDTDNQPVGFVVCEYVEAKEKDMVYIDHLHVMPGHWHGRGIGTALLDAACDWSRAKGFHKVYLYVMEQNTQAVRFYDRKGWFHDQTLITHMARDLPVDTRRYTISLDSLHRGTE